MRYLVDGYNVLFRSLEKESHFEKEKDLLIEFLVEASTTFPFPIILVFDAHKKEEEEKRHHFGKLEIVYTSYKQTADDYILFILECFSKKRKYTVVTSDLSLARKAKGLGAKVEYVDDFFSLLRKKREKKGSDLKKKTSFPTEDTERWLKIFLERYESLE